MWMLGGRGWRGGKSTQHNQPFGLLDAIAIGLGIPQRFPGRVFGVFDLVAGAVSDEDGFAPPFDDYLCFVVRVLPLEEMWRWERGKELTFFPSGIAARSISTFACARTSAEADMLTRKSGHFLIFSPHSHFSRDHLPPLF